MPPPSDHERAPRSVVNTLISFYDGLEADTRLNSPRQPNVPPCDPPATIAQPRLTSRIRLFDDYERKRSRIPNLRHEKRRTHPRSACPLQVSGAESDGDSCVPGMSRSRFALFFVSSRGGKPNLANETERFALPDGRARLLHEQDSPAEVPGYQASPSGLLSSGGAPAASRSALRWASFSSFFFCFSSVRARAARSRSARSLP